MKTLRKVLIVDDDPVVCKSFDRVLSGRGYAVVTVSDGAEALRKIAAEEYDAVFTDIRMPGMDGIAVAEHIKSRQPWLPVVIVSGYATAENEARARAAGVSAVLHKPLSPEMIENSAREALLEKETVAAPAANDLSAGRSVGGERRADARGGIGTGRREVAWTDLGRRSWASPMWWCCHSPAWRRCSRFRFGTAAKRWRGESGG